MNDDVLKPKIIVVVGPTASGKTSLSIELAKRYGGEIISADSRQIYRGLDIGSGKITPTEMDGIPHHLLSTKNPNDVYTVSDFKKDAGEAITEIISRGKLPIIVGGTFFYIDTLLGKSSTPEVPANEQLRAELETKDIAELMGLLEAKDPLRASTIDRKNKRRIIRALEIVEAIGSVPPTQPDEPYTPFTIGVQIEKEVLHKNIHERLRARLDIGMIQEVENLHSEGVSWERLEKLGLEYRYGAQLLQNKISEDEMLTKLEFEIRHFAKRQMTWLKRDQTIHWFSKDEREKTFEEVEKFLKS